MQRYTKPEIPMRKQLGAPSKLLQSVLGKKEQKGEAVLATELIALLANVQCGPREDSRHSTYGWEFASKKARTLGFSYLGEGHFSCVYSHADYPRVVFKYCPRAFDAYHEYATWLIQNQKEGHKNPHLPTVYAAVQKGPAIVYILEELEELDNYDKTSSIRRDAYDVLYGEYRADLFESHSELHIALEDIRKTFKPKQCEFDLHAGNWMQRDDGTLVINDPLGFYINKQKTFDYTFFKKAA